VIIESVEGGDLMGGSIPGEEETSWGEERNCVGKEDFVRRRVDSGWRAFFLE
jgi:hypothetical protein